MKNNKKISWLILLCSSFLMSCSQTKPTIDNKTNKTSEIIKYNRLNQTIPTNYINTTGMEDLDKIRIKILALTADTIKLSDEYRKKSGQDDQTFYQLQMKLIGMSPAEIMQSWNMSSEQEKATIEAMYHRVYDNVQKFDQLKSNFDQNLLPLVISQLPLNQDFQRITFVDELKPSSIMMSPVCLFILKKICSPLILLRCEILMLSTSIFRL